VAGARCGWWVGGLVPTRTTRHVCVSGCGSTAYGAAWSGLAATALACPGGRPLVGRAAVSCLVAWELFPPAPPVTSAYRAAVLPRTGRRGPASRPRLRPTLGFADVGTAADGASRPRAGSGEGAGLGCGPGASAPTDQGPVECSTSAARRAAEPRLSIKTSGPGAKRRDPKSRAECRFCGAPAEQKWYSGSRFQLEVWAKLPRRRGGEATRTTSPSSGCSKPSPIGRARAWRGQRWPCERPAAQRGAFAPSSSVPTGPRVATSAYIVRSAPNRRSGSKGRRGPGRRTRVFPVPARLARSIV
jgi:hypothetical protein